MRKMFRVTALIVVLACSAHAEGIMPNGDEPPPPPPPPATRSATDGEPETGVTGGDIEAPPTTTETFTEVTISLISSVLSLF